MKLVEDFSIASESDSDEDSIASSNMAGRERIITVGLPPPAATTRTFRDSRSSSSFNETEVSNRIKKEAEEEETGSNYEEYAEQGPPQDRLVDWTKSEPPDDYAEEEERRRPAGQMVASEMCWIYETLAEVKPPPGLLPIPTFAAAGGGDDELTEPRFRWRMLSHAVVRLVCDSIMLVFLMVNNKGSKINLVSAVHGGCMLFFRYIIIGKVSS